MRKALIIGIDYYERISRLSGCVRDAIAVRTALERNADGSANFVAPNVLTAPDAARPVYKRELKEAVRELFADDAEVALFYFAGHGHVEDTGGFLCSTECETGDEGLALSEVMSMANRSPARNKILILDSCHSGIAGGHAIAPGVAEISKGVTILTASTAEQVAVEKRGDGGVFTSLFIDAINGAAANLVGDVTPGSAYAHIDQSLGPWAQRPVFKTNVQRFVSLRKADAPIVLPHLRALTRLFPTPDYEFPLDPTYEPERTPGDAADPSIPPPDPVNNATFRTLQQYVRVNLLEPVGAPHMWHAAMGSKACRLTVLGRHYWSLVAKDLI